MIFLYISVSFSGSLEEKILLGKRLKNTKKAIKKSRFLKRVKNNKNYSVKK
jgi:hypothetical protein